MITSSVATKKSGTMVISQSTVPSILTQVEKAT